MDDLISRQEAIKTALEFIVEYLGGAFDEDFQKKLMERMNALPSAQPERKKGKWIYCTTSGHWKCSCCKSKAPWSCEDDISVWHKIMLEWKSSYCPCCGADMRGEQDETD